MTRKRFNKLSLEVTRRMLLLSGYKNVPGYILKWYRDRDITTMKYNSYKEAWEDLKSIRKIVNM